MKEPTPSPQTPMDTKYTTSHYKDGAELVSHKGEKGQFHELYHEWT